MQKKPKIQKLAPTREERLLLLKYLVEDSTYYHIINNMLFIIEKFNEPKDERYYLKYFLFFIQELSADKYQPEKLIYDPLFTKYCFSISEKYNLFSSYFLIRVIIIKLATNDINLVSNTILATNYNLLSLICGKTLYLLLHALEIKQSRIKTIILIQNVLAGISRNLILEDHDKLLKHEYNRMCYTDIDYLDQTTDNCLIVLAIIFNSLILFLNNKSIDSILKKIKQQNIKILVDFIIQYYLYFNYKSN